MSSPHAMPPAPDAPTPVTVRDLTEQDWPAVKAIIDEVIADGATYALGPLTDTQARDFWWPGAPDRAVVAVHADGRVLGSAKMGPNRPAQGRHVGTASFMVSTGARGLGVGRALGEHVLDRLGDDGYAAVQFNAVVETNTSAVALWHRLGFSIVGTVAEAFDHPRHGRVGLHVMHRRLPR